MKDWWDTVQVEYLAYTELLYKLALDKGIAKEVARVVLPEGLTMSKMYMNGTVRSWIHYCQLREKNGTQLEHQDVAVKAKQEILSKFPFLSEVMEK